MGRKLRLRTILGAKYRGGTEREEGTGGEGESSGDGERRNESDIIATTKASLLQIKFESMIREPKPTLSRLSGEAGRTKPFLRALGGDSTPALQVRPKSEPLGGLIVIYFLPTSSRSR